MIDDTPLIIGDTPGELEFVPGTFLIHLNSISAIFPSVIWDFQVFIVSAYYLRSKQLNVKYDSARVAAIIITLVKTIETDKFIVRLILKIYLIVATTLKIY